MGVRERRVSPDNWFPSDLAVSAAKDALEDAQLLPREIDAVIYACGQGLHRASHWSCGPGKAGCRQGDCL